MTRILVPYHLDEHLPTLDVPVGTDRTISPALPDADVWSRLATLLSAVAAAVSTTPSALVVSGDCMTALGTVAGLQRAGIDPAVVWFDAHGDVQTMETTASGYLGGMALRFLLGYRPELLTNRIGLHPVPEDRVTLVDARDLDPPESDYLEASAIRHITVPEVSPDLIPTGPLYVHIDLDVVTPTEIPALRYPAPGGPTLATLVDAINRILATNRVHTIALACTWHPGHDAAEVVKAPLAATLAS